MDSSLPQRIFPLAGGACCPRPEVGTRRELQRAAVPAWRPGLGSGGGAGSFSWAFSLSEACGLSAVGLVCTHREEDCELPVMRTDLSLRV